MFFRLSFQPYPDMSHFRKQFNALRKYQKRICAQIKYKTTKPFSAKNSTKKNVIFKNIYERFFKDTKGNLFDESVSELNKTA